RLAPLRSSAPLKWRPLSALMHNLIARISVGMQANFVICLTRNIVAYEIIDESGHRPGVGRYAPVRRAAPAADMHRVVAAIRQLIAIVCIGWLVNSVPRGQARTPATRGDPDALDRHGKALHITRYVSRGRRLGWCGHRRGAG